MTEQRDGFRACLSQGTADTHEALLAFAGTQKVQRIWTDNSPELIQSCRLMKVIHDRSTPGRPQTNGRAERLVRKVLEGTRTLLLQAGMPPPYWPYAMTHYCFMENVRVGADGDSAWNRRHGKGHFTGPRLPFGCLVDFRQTPSKDDELPKLAPNASPGVLMGYKLLPGGSWNKEYYVAPLTDFKFVDLSVDGDASAVEPQTVKELVPPKVFEFPLKGHYDLVNRTLGGMVEPPSLALEGAMPIGSADALPLPSPSDGTGPPAPADGTGPQVQEGGASSSGSPPAAPEAAIDLEPGTRKRYANTRRPPWIKPGRDWATLPESVKQREAADWKAMQEAAKAKAEVPAAASAPLVQAADVGVPAMPVVPRHPGFRPKHRDRIPCVELPFSACVARPVRKDEIQRTEAARAAMDREYNALRFKKHPALSVPGCWDESAVQERDAVKARARREGRTVHFGTVFGICVEKGASLPLAIVTASSRADSCSAGTMFEIRTGKPRCSKNSVPALLLLRQGSPPTCMGCFPATTSRSVTHSRHIRSLSSVERRPGWPCHATAGRSRGKA